MNEFVDGTEVCLGSNALCN